MKLLKVRGYRAMADISQTKMVELVGCSRASYSAKELGKVNFNPDEMKKVRNLLSEKLGRQLTIDELFF